MFTKRVVLALCCLSVSVFFVVVMCSPVAFGQTAGTVNGLVTDSSGAVVAGATVTLTDKATGTPLTTTSNEAGRYVFVNVIPGLYDVNVSKTGFRQAKMANQKVTVGMQLTLNVTLELGTMSQTVEVSVAAGAELQTENATMGSTVSNDMLLAMPNLNRDASSLLTFQPATAPAVGGGDIYGGQVAGSLSDQNTYMLDGGNITSDLEGDNNYTNNGVGGRGAIPTPLESIEEFKVATNNQTADFFTSAGGQVMMQSKRGGNNFHGSAYEYFQGQFLNANTWDNNRYKACGTGVLTGCTPRPLVKFHDNRFGGGVGGQLFPGKFLGGKTYFYGFYEGRRFPGTAQQLTWTVPSPSLRAGIIKLKDPTTNVVTAYNLNPTPTLDPADGPPQVDNDPQIGQMIPTAMCGAVTCDPRNLGINPVVFQMWNKFMPAANDITGLNTQGYTAGLSLPEREDYGMLRIDHDFGEKWRFFTSYRIYNDILPSTNQIDIGGLLPGDKIGVPRSASSNPTLPRYVVAGLTGQITPHLINEFNASYLLNRWFWQREGVTNALSSIPAGLEFADSHFGCMCPLNMDTQDARNRVWNGHDWNYSDTLNWVKGTHYMQFGGTMIHWWDHHVRDDQVVAGLPEMVYQITKASGLKMSSTDPVTGVTTEYRPTGLNSSLNGSWDTSYAQTLGFIGTEAQLFVRGGNDFHLTGAKTFADTSIIDSYSLYYNDSWKIRPTVTLNYGLEWGTQMPPYEINGVQDFMVDSSGAILTSKQYLQNTVNMALQGKVYNPVLGFEPIGAVGGHPKYPFQPYYGGFSPRVAVAWTPRFSDGFLNRVFGPGKSVLRAGYSRIYDRNNGVDLVLVPLLGYGFGQTIRCNGASISGSCLGSSGTNPTDGFRIGVDGNTGPFPTVQQTLPLPAEPGINTPAGGNLSFLDNNWRPGANDQFTVGIQRELPDNIIVEAAWVGKWSKHLYQGIDLNIVPWMMTLGGQSFAKAYAALYAADSTGKTTVAPQPFFETVLAGSPLCAGFANCSTAVLAAEGAAGAGNISTQSVYTMWQDLERGFDCATACPWNLPPALPNTLQGYNSMIANTTAGFSNYQAGIFRVQKRTGHGLTLNANLTWSHTLSTVGINQEFTQANPSVPFDLRYDYGPAPFDTRWVFNMLGVYQLPFGKGKWLGGNSSVLDKVIGGWSFAPIFQWNSGLVQETYTGSCQEFGQGNVAWCSGAVPLPGASFSRTAHFNVNAVGVGTDGNACPGASTICGAGVNMFADPAAAANNLRPVILGLDGRANDLGPLYGQHRWNLDFSLAKTTRITEKVGFTFSAQFFNALNHMEFSDPGQYGTGGLNLQGLSGFGVLNSQFNNPRHIELGLRVFF